MHIVNDSWNTRMRKKLKAVDSLSATRQHAAAGESCSLALQHRLIIAFGFAFPESARSGEFPAAASVRPFSTVGRLVDIFTAAAC